MSHNPEIHKRKSIRLKGYDYSQEGLYFITLCCQNRECLFGQIHNGSMILNDAGKMIENEWLNLENRFPNIELHEFIVMPNHFHGILKIVGAALVAAQSTQSTLVAAQSTPVRAALVAAQSTQSTLVAAQSTPVRAALVAAQSTQSTLVDAQSTLVDARNEMETQTIEGQPQGIAPTKTIGDMMGAFKSITTVEYIRGVKNLGWKPFDGKIWQRNYYEHIIRNEQSYQNISNYIINNPAKWQDDKFYGQ
jgi:REP element-mobilizing transposase RayT